MFYGYWMVKMFELLLNNLIILKVQNKRDAGLKFVTGLFQISSSSRRLCLLGSEFKAGTCEELTCSALSRADTGQRTSGSMCVCVRG